MYMCEDVLRMTHVGGSQVVAMCILFDAESLFQIRLVRLHTTCSEFVVRIPRKHAVY